MTRLALSDLSVTEFAPILREYERRTLKDKSYQRTPIGREVKHYLQTLRWDGAPQTTLDTYEMPLARLALWLADYESLHSFCSPVGTQYLREFLDTYWGDLSEATRGNRLSIVKSFFAWALGEGKIGFDPARPIRRPKARNRIRQAHAQKVIRQLVHGQDSLRDEVLLLLMARLGLRKNDVRMLQVKDVDLTRNALALRHVKGGGEALLPFEDDEIARLLYLVIVGEDRQPDEYLLYPKRDRLRPMDSSSVHRWFKNCLERAGLPESIEMHELRHTAADELWRHTGDLVMAQQLLRHKSVSTTQAYLHPSENDLRGALRAVAAARAQG